MARKLKIRKSQRSRYDKSSCLQVNTKKKKTSGQDLTSHVPWKGVKCFSLSFPTITCHFSKRE